MDAKAEKDSVAEKVIQDLRTTGQKSHEKIKGKETKNGKWSRRSPTTKGKKRKMDLPSGGIRNGVTGRLTGNSNTHLG